MVRGGKVRLAHLQLDDLPALGFQFKHTIEDSLGALRAQGGYTGGKAHGRSFHARSIKLRRRAVQTGLGAGAFHQR